MNVARDDGSSAVEYGLLVAGIAAVLVAGVALLGGMVRAAFTHATACYAQGQPGFTPPTDPTWAPEQCGQTPPPTPPPEPTAPGARPGPAPFPAG